MYLFRKVCISLRTKRGLVSSRQMQTNNPNLGASCDANRQERGQLSRPPHQDSSLRHSGPNNRFRPFEWRSEATKTVNVVVVRSTNRPAPVAPLESIWVERLLLEATSRQVCKSASHETNKCARLNPIPAKCCPLRLEDRVSWRQKIINNKSANNDNNNKRNSAGTSSRHF